MDPSNPGSSPFPPRTSNHGRITCSKDVAGCSGSDENEHSMEDMNKLMEEKVINKTAQEIILKNSQP